ncbi:MAG: sugar ABC transporter permease [Oscillospiraceae bacterium]|nr:sugar ABC transporter permease [Oscillospiraceae bacterium]
MNKNQVAAFFQKYTMILALFAVIIFFAISTGGKILYPQNINNLISQNAYVFVLATGMLLCILTGGNIDLAVGSVVCFAGALGAVMMKAGLNVWAAVLVMLATGLLIGLFQGFWVAKISMPPFIVTLAGMYAFRGLSNVVLDGYAVAVNNTTFLNTFGGGADCYIPDFFGSDEKFNLTCMIVGVIVTAVFIVLEVLRITKEKKNSTSPESVKVAPQAAKDAVICVVILWMFYMLSRYKGIPTALIWIAATLLIYNYILSRTAPGRHLYAVGGNEKATLLSGINTKLVYLFAYTVMGLLSGFAGILTIARAASVQPTYGQGYEMDAIAACFIGGASAYGGTGKISGVLIGASLLGIINQGMSIMGIDANYQKVVKGIVLLVAVMFDILSKREKK